MTIDDEIRRIVTHHLDAAAWPVVPLDGQLIRSRGAARRRARIVSGVGAAAIAMVLVTTIAPGGGGTVMTTSKPGSKTESVDASEPPRHVVGADKLHVVCGQRMPALVEPAMYHALDLEVAHRDVAANEQGIRLLPASVRLVNSTESQLRGTVGVPLTAVIQNGVVVSINTARRPIGYGIDLAPGESTKDLVGAISLTRCSDSIPLPPGSYQYYVWTGATWFSDATKNEIPWGGPWNLEITTS